MRVKLLETITPESPALGAEQYMVTMSDGVRLATDVYLPSSPVRHAAILVRTPYDKTSRYTGLPWHAKYYNARGYVLVAQDTRGKARSEGETLPYRTEVSDAYDTIEWISQQAWSDGTVGLTGASYYGFTTWAGVASGHASVRAAIPQVTSVEMANSHVASQWTQEVPSLIGVNDLAQIWTDSDSYLIDIDYSAAPVVELLGDVESLIGPSIGIRQLLERARTGEYYNPYGERHPYRNTDVPILHWTNWYDPGLAPGGMAGWRHFRSLPGRRDLHYLRAGSADHSGYALQDVGRGDEANPYLSDTTHEQLLNVELNEAMDFFDEHVRGMTPRLRRPRARWHLGHVGWKQSEEWTPTDSVPTPFYLTARQNDTRGTLSDTPDVSTREVAWTHDPANPVPSTTSIEEIWYFLAAYPDERALAERDDVLTFTGDPLRAVLDIAGQPLVQAEMGSSAPSMHVFATLQDVAPDGTTRPISMGYMVTRSRRGEPVMLPLSDIAYRFQVGHCVQLQVRSSNFPWYLPHPGTDENPWFAEKLVPSRQTLRTGGTGAAFIELPVVPSGDSP